MKTSTFKRGMALFLALLLCFTTFVGSAVTPAFAAAAQSEVCVLSFPRDGDANYSANWGHPDLNFTGGWHDKSTRFLSVHAVGSFTGEICYCIEPGVNVLIGDKVSQKDESFWDNYPSNLTSYSRQCGGVVQNLENALEVWNGKLSEIWQLITLSPQNFKGGVIWNVVVNIHGGLQAIGYALLVLFFVVGVAKTCANFSDLKRPEVAVKMFVRFALAKGLISYTQTGNAPFLCLFLAPGRASRSYLGLHGHFAGEH